MLGARHVIIVRNIINIEIVHWNGLRQGGKVTVVMLISMVGWVSVKGPSGIENEERTALEIISERVWGGPEKPHSLRKVWMTIGSWEVRKEMRGMRGKSKLLSCVQLFAIPRTVARQAPLSMEFFRQEYWNGLPFPTLRDLPNPGIKPEFPGSPALGDPLCWWMTLLPTSKSR